MKRILYIILILLFTQTYGQKYEHSLEGIDKIVFGISGSGDIQVKLIPENQLRIESDDISPVPEKAKGLRPIGRNGVYNTGMGLSIKKKGTTLFVNKIRGHSSDDYEIYVPQRVGLSITQSLSGDIDINDIQGEIEVKTLSGNIRLRNVAGPIIAHTTSGHIDVRFTSLDQSSPSSIVSVSGDVDIRMPADTSLNLVTKTISGNAYTDFELKVPDSKGKSMRHISGSSYFESHINGGGVQLKARTISGDIYLRKN